MKVFSQWYSSLRGLLYKGSLFLRVPVTKVTEAIGSVKNTFITKNSSIYSFSTKISFILNSLDKENMALYEHRIELRRYFVAY